MTWEGRVARVGRMRNACKILVGIPEGKSSIGYLGVGGRIILKCILDK
jgi:hypothetical protein